MQNISNFKSKKVLVISAVFAVIFFTISAVIFLNTQQQKKHVSALSSSISLSTSSSYSTTSSNSFKSQSSEQNSQTSSSEDSTRKAVSSNNNLNLSKSSSSLSITTQNNITLVGEQCRGPQTGYNLDGYCRVFVDGQEKGRIYFSQYTSSLTQLDEKGFKLQANGYFYMDLLKKTDKVQYIRWISIGSLGGMIYQYDFTTEEISFVEEFYYEGFNPQGHSLITSYNKEGCTDPNIDSYWDYSCFYVIDNSFASGNPTDRYILQNSEIEAINKAKKSFFYYNKMAPVYGLPLAVNPEGNYFI